MELSFRDKASSWSTLGSFYLCERGSTVSRDQGFAFQVAQAIVDVSHELFPWHFREFLSERFDYVIEG
jgi:hypothetical protein